MGRLERFLSSAGSRSTMRNSVIVLLDVATAALAFAGAYYTVMSAEPALQVPGLADKTLGLALCATLSFLLFGLYRGSWRYVSTPDLVAIIKASALAVGIYTVAAFLATRGQNVPRSVLVLSFIYMVGGLAGIRLAYRIACERGFTLVSQPSLARANDRRKVILCGYTDQAEALIRSLRREGRPDFEVVGILDDAKLNHGRMMQGVKVLGGLRNLRSSIEGLRRRGILVDEIIVTENSPSRKRLVQILDEANTFSLKVSRVPSLTETDAITNATLVRARPIELGDLLERPEVSPDLESVAKLIEGRVVLATGACGSVGSELCRQIAEFRPEKLVLLDISEFDLYTLDTELRDEHPGLSIEACIVNVRDRARVQQLFATHKPEVVFHAAALKHVPLVEDNPLEAIKTNLLGTRNVADAALANEVTTFVMVSTDKAVNPASVMGATKRAAETYCQALDVTSRHTRFTSVRFGNVLGSSGSVVPRFQKQIAAGGPVTVSHPQVMRYFMTISEAVRLVLHACGQSLSSNGDERGTVMVLDMGKPVRIIDLAERMIQMAGHKPYVDIDIVFSGLRPGEKLFEELFDDSELQGGRTEEGYMIVTPRIVDRKLLERSLANVEAASADEDLSRALHLLSHIVPEYGRSIAARPAPSADGALQPGTRDLSSMPSQTAERGVDRL